MPDTPPPRHEEETTGRRSIVPPMQELGGRVMKATEVAGNIYTEGPEGFERFDVGQESRDARIFLKELGFKNFFACTMAFRALLEQRNYLLAPATKVGPKTRRAIDEAADLAGTEFWDAVDVHDQQVTRLSAEMLKVLHEQKIGAFLQSKGQLNYDMINRMAGVLNAMKLAAENAGVEPADKDEKRIPVDVEQTYAGEYPHIDSRFRQLGRINSAYKAAGATSPEYERLYANIDAILEGHTPEKKIAFLRMGADLKLGDPKYIDKIVDILFALEPLMPGSRALEASRQARLQERRLLYLQASRGIIAGTLSKPAVANQIYTGIKTHRREMGLAMADKALQLYQMGGTINRRMPTQRKFFDRFRPIETSAELLINQCRLILHELEVLKETRLLARQQESGPKV